MIGVVFNSSFIFVNNFISASHVLNNFILSLCVTNDIISSFITLNNFVSSFYVLNNLFRHSMSWMILFYHYMLPMIFFHHCLGMVDPIPSLCWSSWKLGTALTSLGITLFYFLALMILIHHYHCGWFYFNILYLEWFYFNILVSNDFVSSLHWCGQPNFRVFVRLEVELCSDVYRDCA